MPIRPYAKITNRRGHCAEKLLGEPELAIMQVVWDREAVTVRDMVAALQKRRPAKFACTGANVDVATRAPIVLLQAASFDMALSLTYLQKQFVSIQFA